ncbi:uncharacterized protein LOC126957073 [Macaca thibetana thibetana]|uniref:uncharacterized protein LOC126957073 n=1 Tax=Macaca thibetana thibetana TaxID=257877 RepID=UPI0021BCBA38|nr:uncharacterized protein LOC126957073 [Macaca thibetana thibetana]
MVSAATCCPHDVLSQCHSQCACEQQGTPTHRHRIEKAECKDGQHLLNSTEDLQEKPPWKVKEAWREQESATVTNQIIPEAVVARRKRTGGLGAHVKRRFKFLAAELPSEKSTEKVLAVFKRDSAFQSSGPMEGPVEKFIYESDEEAPRQWQVRPPAVVTEKAGGLPEEKGSRKEPLEDSNKGSAEDASQYLKVPTRPLPAPPEKAKETNPEQAEEIKPSELKEDEDVKEPELTCCGLTCCGLCISWWKSLKASEGCPENILQATDTLSIAAPEPTGLSPP